MPEDSVSNAGEYVITAGVFLDALRTLMGEVVT
jgi:hypothetical protein